MADLKSSKTLELLFSIWLLLHLASNSGVNKEQIWNNNQMFTKFFIVWVDNGHKNSTNFHKLFRFKSFSSLVIVLYISHVKVK